MKGTDRFKTTIQSYLEQKALSDELFAITFKKEGKTIDDCITYILNTVQKSGCNGFTDEEIFGMALHYYDENSIDIGKDNPNVNVVVNHHIELTEEEKKEAYEKGIQQAIEDARKSMQKKNACMTPKPKEEKQGEQISLF